MGEDKVDDFGEITDEQWADYSERLTRHAVKEFWKHGWKSGEDGWAGPGGTTPDDIAQEVIRRVLQGRRRYNSEAYDDFLDFLRHAANSLINHLATHEKEEGTISLSDWLPDEDATPEDFEYASDAPDPREECLSRERRDQIKAAALRCFADDPMLMQVLDCLEAGITKRAEIAEWLGVDPEEIDNAKRKMCRKLKKELDF